MNPTLFYLPIVGVMCGGKGSYKKSTGPSSYEHSAPELGKAIAGLGWNLLTGGGAGAMTAVTAAYNAAKKSQDQTCASMALLPKGASNKAHADIAINTQLRPSAWDRNNYLYGDSRNHLNVRLADLVVGLPGGPGTLSELKLALQHSKPCIAFLRDEADLIATMDATDLKGLGIPVSNNITGIVKFLRKHGVPLLRSPVKQYP